MGTNGNKWDNQEDQESKLTDQRVSDKMNLRVCHMGKNVGSGKKNVGSQAGLGSNPGSIYILIL